MHKKRRIISNFDGLNMSPAFSKDGKKAVYSASRADGSCQLYYYDAVSFYKLTHNEGNNISPSISDDGKKIYFCSDYETGLPQIYMYHTITSALERITDGVGYCTSPCYSSKRSQLVYARMVQGIMQLFLYDEHSKKHSQLTFDEGSKEESVWSPCGNYLLYSVQKGRVSHLISWHMYTNKKQLITSMQDNCAYPAWSGKYKQFPVCSG
jgi:Tol biopolymer transport system component